MATEIIFNITDSLEGGYEASALGYSIFTEGDNLEELKKNIKEAVHTHFDENQPKLVRLHFVREEVIPL